MTHHYALHNPLFKDWGQSRTSLAQLILLQWMAGCILSLHTVFHQKQMRVSHLCFHTPNDRYHFLLSPSLVYTLYHCAELCNPRCISVIKHCEKLSSVFSVSPLGIIILPSIPLLTCDTKWKKNYTLIPLLFLSLSLQQNSKDAGGGNRQEKTQLILSCNIQALRVLDPFPKLPNHKRKLSRHMLQTVGWSQGTDELHSECFFFRPQCVLYVNPFIICTRVYYTMPAPTR